MSTVAKSARVRRPELTEMVSEAEDLKNLFIGQKLFPVYPVKTQAGEYFKRTIVGGGLMRPIGLRREPRGAYPRVERQFERANYRTFEYGAEEAIDESEAAEVEDIFDAEQDAGILLRTGLELGYEQRVKSKIFNPASWAGGAVNPTAAYTEANLATINFILDMDNLRDAFINYGVQPNTLVIPGQVWNRLRRSRKLIEQLMPGAAVGGVTQDRRLTPEDLAKIFPYPVTIHIPEVPVDNSVQGDTAASVSRIWTNNYIWLGKVVGGRFKAGGAGRTLVWDADSPGGLYTTDTYEDDKIRSSVVRVRMNTDEKIIDPTCGILLATDFA